MTRKKTVLICVAVAMLIDFLSFASFCGYVNLHTGTLAEGIDINHTGGVLPQEWGLAKTPTTAMRSLSASQFQMITAIQSKSVTPKLCAGNFDAASKTQSAASGHAYLNNLSLRC